MSSGSVIFSMSSRGEVSVFVEVAALSSFCDAPAEDPAVTSTELVLELAALLFLFVVEGVLCFDVSFDLVEG